MVLLALLGKEPKLKSNPLKGGKQADRGIVLVGDGVCPPRLFFFFPYFVNSIRMDLTACVK